MVVQEEQKYESTSESLRGGPQRLAGNVHAQRAQAAEARIRSGDAAPQPAALHHGPHGLLSCLPLEYRGRGSALLSPVAAVIRSAPPQGRERGEADGV